MHNKQLVILTCIFKWQPFWYFCYPAFTDSHSDFISHVLKYLFFTRIHKRDNATLAYFLKFMSIFFKIHRLLTSLGNQVLWLHMDLFFFKPNCANFENSKTCMKFTHFIHNSSLLLEKKHL